MYNKIDKYNMVKHWFGESFQDLHPLLQRLHTNDSKLQGNIEILYGSGIARLIARRLAARLGIPAPGKHRLEVDIFHREDGLHWDRSFNDESQMKSTFVPVGSKPDGYWIEHTGPIKLYVTVDIIDGGWHWRCLKIKVLGVPLPLWLFPKSKAFKMVENGQYRFEVEFTMPLIGRILRYGGLLQLSDA